MQRFSNCLMGVHHAAKVDAKAILLSRAEVSRYIQTIGPAAATTIPVTNAATHENSRKSSSTTHGRSPHAFPSALSRGHSEASVTG